MPETKFFSKEITLSAGSQPAGVKFPARLAYRTFGSPSNPAVLLPTCYGGSLADTLPFLYSDEEAAAAAAAAGGDASKAPPPLPTSRFFIIITGLLSGGESSSPSNTPAPFDGPRFPRTTYEDNVCLQHALCVEALGVSRLFAYIGFSMGGQQAYHMAARFPAFVEHAVCLAGSARTSTHNWSFLEGPRHALITARDFHDGEYVKVLGAGKQATDGIRAFFRVYSTWALSQEWFRQRCWEQAAPGFASLEAYLEAEWTTGGDANDLLALLWTWQQGDITVYYPGYGGDLAKSLARIETKMLVMPSRTDMYFPPLDNEEEVRHLRHGEFRCIESIWGHLAAGGGGTNDDTEFIKKEVKRFLGV